VVGEAVTVGLMVTVAVEDTAPGGLGGKVSGGMVKSRGGVGVARRLLTYLSDAGVAGEAASAPGATGAAHVVVLTGCYLLRAGLSCCAASDVCGPAAQGLACVSGGAAAVWLVYAGAGVCVVWALRIALVEGKDCSR